MLDSLILLQETIEYINADYTEHLCLASLLVYPCCRAYTVFSKMQAQNLAPTVLENVYFFDLAMKENVKQLTKTGFHYYIAYSSLHEWWHFLTSDVPNIPEFLAKSMFPPDQ